MKTISLCMIVKDEEETLGRCLESVKDVVDEIIVVDTGSKDRTKEVALRYTELVYEYEWRDDFSAARNYSYSKASKEYIMWLDADDVMDREEAEKLRELKEGISSGTGAVMMRYNTGYDMKGRVTQWCYRERLTRRDRNYEWREPVHEYIEVIGEREISEISIRHERPAGRRNSGRNIRIYEECLKRGEGLTARGTYYYGRELKESGRYREAIGRFREFLSSGRGWKEDKITASLELAGCLEAEGRGEEALEVLYHSFVYGKPRAEICCEIGRKHRERGEVEEGIYWYERALEQEGEGKMGFRRADYWGFIPSIELAVCYDRIGEYEKAEWYNEKAGEYKPESPAVIYNRRYFEVRRRELNENGYGS